jgi:4,5-dihydroxyphthalate decarboxylase
MEYLLVSISGGIAMDELSIAIATSGLTRDLKEGRVDAGGLRLNHIEVSPITAAMRRMVRGLAFDVCEMAITTYLCARGLGKPFTAIPVFVTRNFHHGAIFRTAGSDIREPKDLEGRMVGVNRGYTVTTGIWARGILASEYGVDLESITWAATDDEHVAEFKAPANVDYSNQGTSIVDLLAGGTVEAGVGAMPPGATGLEHLISDPLTAGAAYYGKTGVYPINHTIVVKDEVLRDRPEIAQTLFQAFKASKDAHLARLDARTDLNSADETAIALAEIVGDPFPFGVEPNRKAVDTVIGFALDQGVIAERMNADDLFAAGTADLT